MKINNPFTLEERCKVAQGLFGHDGLKLLSAIDRDLRPIAEEETEVFTLTDDHKPKYVPLDITKNAREAMTNTEVVRFVQKCNWVILDDSVFIEAAPKRFVDSLKDYSQLEKYQDIRFQINGEDNLKDLVSDDSILFSVFLNLYNNAARSGTEINLDFQRQSVVPSSVVYESSNNQNLNRNGWLEMTVSDNGKGFDSSLNWREYLNRDVSSTGSGFGLYFVRLMADYLGGSIGIESKPKDTKISLYHPMYTE
jgi:signal transduction histidine kinase